MNTMHNVFPKLTDSQVDWLYAFFLARVPSMEEQQWLIANANDSWLTNGVMAFSMPWDPNKKTLLLYGCCHVAQLCKFWFQYSTSRFIQSNYNVVIAQNYRVKGDAHYLGGEGACLGTIPETHRELFHALFRRADLVITHAAYGGSEFSPEWIVALTQPNVRVLKFHSPSFGALWPVCYYGDSWAKALLRKGMPPAEMISRINRGTLKCHLQARWAESFLRLERKDKACDVPIAPFFAKHWKHRRMFTTFNHPTFTLMGYQAMQLERMVDPRDSKPSSLLDTAMIMGLPWDACQMRPLWPDHTAAKSELGLRYSDWIADTEGFLAKEVWRCYDEMKVGR